mgnify:FL=1|tara:strand:- start:89 stop:751 length:663 start_codon:yes stop_codon:yes gene_type:complete
MKKHLSFWEDHCDVETFQSWCGDFNIPFKNNIRELIRQAGHKDILDCGAGVFSEYFGFKNDNYEVNYTAVEITPSFVELGQKKGINCVCSSIDKIPFEDNEFDATICLDVLNHQLDYEEAIREMVRVTKNVIFISFFKPFMEESSFKGSLSHWSPKKIKETPNGILLERVSDKDEEAVCIHHYFSIEKIDKFLTALNVKRSIAAMHDDKGEIIRVLKIEK